MDHAFRDHLAHGRQKQAATWLVRHHAPEVRGLCVAMCGNEGEDLAQEVFIRAFGALEGFRGEASTRTWILAIARNRCLDHLRRQQRAPVELEEEVDPEGPLDDSPLPSWMVQDRDEVRRALDALAEVPRAMVQLRFVHGLDYAELGGVFGIKPGTARMRISRALARMRLELEPPAEAISLCLDDSEDLEAAIEPPAAGAAPPAPAPSRSRFGGLRRRSATRRLSDFGQVLATLDASKGRYEARLVALTRALPEG